MRRTLTALAGGYMVIASVQVPGRAEAADMFEQRSYPGGPPGYEDPGKAEHPPLPRYFPREGSESDAIALLQPRRIAKGCRPRRVPIPTNAPDDPSYVGSTYGLGKPSYYGFVPALGIDDPFGRPVLPYCR